MCTPLFCIDKEKKNMELQKMAGFTQVNCEELKKDTDKIHNSLYDNE